ncbi:hypothetical protein BKA61DRAFT_450573, partial [Leptodontidium sp. MPI-SDFR-AT-0119]
ILPPVGFHFVDWWTSQAFACPLWRGTLPIGAHESTCSNIWTRTHTKASMTARLYQVPGSWQTAPRYSEIVNGVDDAIEKGLNIFGSFAGPLTINIGILSGLLGSRVQVDYDNNIKNPCYILIGFPAEWNNIPLLAIQKDVIQGMYQCVEQFHHPAVGTWTDGNTWWRKGVARYFDGLAYPATSAIMNNGLYPEEYQKSLALFKNDDAAALFFHFADGAGWSPADVSNWVKTHANKNSYDEERQALSGDAKIVPLWHKFNLAFVDNTIKYPGGQQILNRLGGLPGTVYSAVDLAPGGSYSKTFGVDSFRAQRLVFPIRAGQSMRVSTELEDGIEWSIRKAGTTTWNSGNRGRSVNIAAAAGSNTNYEIVVSSTSND